MSRLSSVVMGFILMLSYSGLGQAGEFKVGMEGWEFNPAKLTIQVGDKVTWLNDDDTAHNLAFEIEFETAPTRSKPTKVRMNKEYSLVFNKAGVYKYICKIHESYDMKGVIVVSSEDKPVLKKKPPPSPTRVNVK